MHQIRLVKEENIAIVNLSTFFYPLHVLQQAAAQFVEVATISVREENGRAIAEIRPKGKEHAGETALQFCNFALALRRGLGEYA